MIYPFANIILFSLFMLFVRKFHNIELLPKPPFIIAANHDSYLDPLVLGPIVVKKTNKHIHFLAMKGRFWDMFGDRISRRWAGCVPLDEGKEKAIDELIRLLKKGDTVGIFPGGPRSLDGNLNKGKTGALRLALAAKCPIVPVGIIGAYDIAPGDRILPRLKRCEIKFGKPIYYDKYHNKKITKSLLRKLTDDLMEDIAKLANKKYLYK